MASFNSTSQTLPFANNLKNATIRVQSIIPPGFFTNLVLGDHSVIHTVPYLKLNPRHSWAEASIFVFAKLREGHHPDQIRRFITVVTSIYIIDQYQYEFLCAAVTMLKNLHAHGLFVDLPTYDDYSRIMTSRCVRDVEASYIYMAFMGHLFNDFGVFNRQILDPVVEQSLNDAPGMNPLSLLLVGALQHKYNIAITLTSATDVTKVMAIPTKTTTEAADYAPHAGAMPPTELKSSPDINEVSPITGSEGWFSPPLSPMSTDSTSGTVGAVDPFVDEENLKPKANPFNTFTLHQPRPVRQFNFRFADMSPELEMECEDIAAATMYERKLNITKRRQVKRRGNSPTLVSKAASGMLSAFSSAFDN